MTPDDRTDASGVIVAGYDGSPQAMAAVRYALTDAARRGLGVRVVTAFPRWDRWAEVCDLAFRVEFPDAVARAVAVASACVDEIVDTDPALGEVPVGVAAVAGRPEAVLVEESRDASGLVLGRGEPGAGSGPVARRCMARARCPVTVVRAAAPPIARRARP